MQLVELQHHFEQFERRGISIVALSVDEPEDAHPMLLRLGLQYPVVSDTTLKVIRSFGLENPEVEELALHATYIIDAQGEVLYRKVARRRPLSTELLAAVDHHRGQPFNVDESSSAPPRPWRNWRLVDAVDRVVAAQGPNADVSPEQRAELEAIFELLTAAHEDQALRLWRAYCRAHMTTGNAARVLELGQWLMRRAYVDGVEYRGPLEDLRDASARLRTLRQQVGDGARSAAQEQAIDAALGEVGRAADTLGDLSQGHLRSLWDLKSMLKAMVELHAAHARSLR